MNAPEQIHCFEESARATLHLSTVTLAGEIIYVTRAAFVRDVITETIAGLDHLQQLIPADFFPASYGQVRAELETMGERFDEIIHGGSRAPEESNSGAVDRNSSVSQQNRKATQIGDHGSFRHPLA